MSRELIEDVRRFARAKAETDTKPSRRFGHRKTGQAVPPSSMDEAPEVLADALSQDMSQDMAQDMAQDLSQALAAAPRTLRRPPRVEEPVTDLEDPAFGDDDDAAFEAAFEEPAPAPLRSPATSRHRVEAAPSQPSPTRVRRRVSDHAEASDLPRANIVLVAAAEADTLAETAQVGLALARKLALGGRALVMTLDGSTNQNPLGLADLLRGATSFPHVIYRDGNTRLHRLDQGTGDIFLTEAFSFILDALMQTYDHLIILAGPAEGPASDGLAYYADTAVLAARPDLRQSRMQMLTDRLTTAGAKEVVPTALLSAQLDRSAA